jgi:hypothetical protein
MGLQGMTDLGEQWWVRTGSAHGQAQGLELRRQRQGIVPTQMKTTTSK